MSPITFSNIAFATGTLGATFKVSNPLNAQLNNVAVTMFMNPGGIFTASTTSPSASQITTSSITWTGLSFGAQETKTFSVSGVVGAAPIGTALVFSVSVSASGTAPTTGKEKIYIEPYLREGIPSGLVEGRRLAHLRGPIMHS